MPADVVLGIDSWTLSILGWSGGRRVADGRDLSHPTGPLPRAYSNPFLPHERNPLPEATDRDEGGRALYRVRKIPPAISQAEQGNPTAQIGIAQHHAQEAQEKERRVEE